MSNPPFGRSPLLDALPVRRELAKVPPEEYARAAARHVEQRLGFDPSNSDYDDGFEAGLQEAWKRVNDWIVKGELSGNGCDAMAQRNGMVLAANLIIQPQGGRPRRRRSA